MQGEKLDGIASCVGNCRPLSLALESKQRFFLFSFALPLRLCASAVNGFGLSLQRGEEGEQGIAIGVRHGAEGIARDRMKPITSSVAGPLASAGAG
jgi:hypothetical protein